MSDSKLEKSYSADEETWTDYCSVIDHMLESYSPGDEVTIYEGDSVPFTHAEFVSAETVIENIQELSYDDIGEWQQDYLDEISSDKGLIAELQTTLMAFFEKHAKAPTCFKVENIKEIKVTLEA